jgi:Calx-beta domain
VTLTEGNTGTKNFVFNVQQLPASSQTVTVKYFTANGTATASSDYTALPLTTLTFSPGQTNKQVAVPVIGNTVVEPNEYSGVTQELKSAIRCWCYEHHQHCNNPCPSNVPHWFTVSQHADELWEFSASVRSHIPRYFAPSPLSESPLVTTALGLLRAKARADGRLSDH